MKDVYSRPESRIASSTGAFAAWFGSLLITGWITDEKTMRFTPSRAQASTTPTPAFASPGRNAGAR